MRKYAGYVSTANTVSATLPIWALVAATTIRPKLYDIVCSTDATPADNVMKFAMRRSTAAGTATAVTANALDPNDAASAAIFNTPYTVTPTITANSDVFDWAQNTRATFRWVAAPDGELVLANTANAGLAAISVTANVVTNIVATEFWSE